MIENARRQLILVALVSLAALYFIATQKFNYGLDLRGGTQLIYNIPIEEDQQKGLIDKNADPDRIMQETLRIFDNRIDPRGTTEHTITLRGERDVLIELPDVSPAEAAAIERRIETLGKLEMRVLAADDYNEGGVKFDLTKEKEKLEAWLKLDNHRDTLRGDPQLIRRFNVLAEDKGGPNPNLKWYAGIIKPSKRDPEKWDYSYAALKRDNVVALFDDAEYEAGPTKDKQVLWELFPINMHEEHFTGEDMDAAGVAAGTDPKTGLPCVFYALGAEKSSAYADWSDKYKGKPSAIILNQVVRSAPTFQGRILGSGVITGGFTVGEADDLAKIIKTGSLQVKPVRKSKIVIGATLGQDSIKRGLFSIGLGGALVLLFILAYYRLAGLVAFAAIALNVFLIIGILLFIRATLTLPGIGGLVLTMGMAVDANILIYERIREERQKGKEMLQAVRTGFDRAMTTIIDANITTFLAGVVLYNVGVGPVRGFAVTLMIGIMTSVFTAFFVSRLVFHFLLEKRWLTDFKVAGWLSDTKFQFIRFSRAAFTASIIVIVAGLGYYALRVPWDRAFGLDFTGGANLQIVLQEPVTKAALRDRLLANAEFKKDFPDPIINTVGPTETGKASSFIVKLKLTDRLRQEIETEKAEKAAQGSSYVPRYERQLRETLAGQLVRGGFGNEDIIENPSNPGMDFGQVDVHFARPVSREALLARLAKEYGADTAVTPEDVPASTDYTIVIDVEPGTQKELLGEKISDAIQERPGADDRQGQPALMDETGQPATLSEPIPQSETIGGRMVDELRNAAIGAILLSMFLIVMYIRIRFHEYKYGIGAVIALIHDILVTFVVIVAANYLGLVNAEIDLAMIAAFLTVIGYSINDTIVIFDRVRENLQEHERLGDSKETFADLIDRSINQTLSRTILTSGTTLFVVLAQLIVNYGAGTSLEGFSFALIVGIVSGTYSTVFIASPVVLWLRQRETTNPEGAPNAVAKGQTEAVKTTA